MVVDIAHCNAGRRNTDNERMRVAGTVLALLFDPDISVSFKVFAQGMLPNKFLIFVRIEDILFYSSSGFQLDSDQIFSVFWPEPLPEEYLFVFIYRESPVGNLSPNYLGHKFSHLYTTVRAHTFALGAGSFAHLVI